MKLIQILALATAMATMATAQSTGANSQATATPSPTAVTADTIGPPAKPAAKKKRASGQQSGTAKSGGTPAKATDASSGTKAGTSTTKGGTAPSTAASKSTVKTSTAPVKSQTSATPAKGTPTPVVAAKPADAKKTEAKKPDTKKAATPKAPTPKAPTPKTPAVIAVKPPQATKATQTKAAAKPPAKTPSVKTPPAQVTSVAPAAKPAEKPKPSARSFGAHGRRDPFVSPIVSDRGGVNRPPSNCTSGKRCLVIPELVLQGTVKDTTGKMMAVVANSVRKTYFLRENDQVFQGSVEKITSDSIIFREYVKDSLGRETAREVVKKLAPPTS